VIKPQNTAAATTTFSATSSLATPAAHKCRQPEFDVQCGKSMECLQDLMKARLEKKTNDYDDIFRKMTATKLKISALKEHCRKK